MPVATLESGAAPRVVANRNDLVAAYPWVSGVKTGYTLERRQRAGRAPPSAAAAPAWSAWCSASRPRPPATPRRSTLLRWGLRRFQPRPRARPRGVRSRAADIEYRDERRGSCRDAGRSSRSATASGCGAA